MATSRGVATFVLGDAMGEFLPLEALGQRIVICGPSNAGKSTLAVALGRKLNTQVFHVDLFRHLPDTNWVQRPDEDFRALHDAAILGESWVIDGNYPRLMPKRLERATGLVLVGGSRWANLRRYLWRTLFQPDRAGSLAGREDSLKWEMIRWVFVVQPRNRQRDRDRLRATGLPLVELASMAELKRLYAAWELVR